MACMSWSSLCLLSTDPKTFHIVRIWFWCELIANHLEKYPSEWLQYDIFSPYLAASVESKLKHKHRKRLATNYAFKGKMVTMNAYVSTIWMIIDCKCSLYMRASWSVLHKRCCKSSYVLWCRNSFSWLIFSGRKTSLTLQHQLEYLMVHSFLHPVLWLCFSEATLVCASCPYLF